MTKKFLAIVMSVIICISMNCISAFAYDELAAELPEGAVKIAEGIYVYTPPYALHNDSGEINIGTVPGYGNIIQPGMFNNIIVDEGHNWLHVRCSNTIKINFVRGNQNVFGTNLFDWPTVGGDINSTYYIHADSYNIARNVAYQLQCTSISDNAQNNTKLRIFSKRTGN